MTRRGTHSHYRNNQALRLFRRFVPVTEEYHGDNFFVKRDSKRGTARAARPAPAAVMVNWRTAAYPSPTAKPGV
jgi:hypothetical protein